MLEYFAGLQLRALLPYYPVIPNWMWRAKVRLRTATKVVRGGPYTDNQGRRLLYQTRYYAVRAGKLYLHRGQVSADGTKTSWSVIDIPGEVLALREIDDSSPPGALPVVLTDNSDQYYAQGDKRLLIPLKQPFSLREFEAYKAP
jgi:hypothetical protein